jgi:hypothetical protein
VPGINSYICDSSNPIPITNGVVNQNIFNLCDHIKNMEDVKTYIQIPSDKENLNQLGIYVASRDPNRLKSEEALYPNNSSHSYTFKSLFLNKQYIRTPTSSGKRIFMVRKVLFLIVSSKLHS